MTEMTPVVLPPMLELIPETAPFSREQRRWLNGFFAGLLSAQAEVGAAMVEPPPAPVASEDDAAPWHDAAMPIGERMALAQSKPLPRQLYAAMAQQDCGQCGYLCETYSKAIADGSETKLNLCIPGGKDTSRMLKRLLEGVSPRHSVPSPLVGEGQGGGDCRTSKVGVPPTPNPSPQGGGESARRLSESQTPARGSREAPVEVIFRSATRLNGNGSDKDTRHVVIDIAGSGLEYVPGDSFGIYPRNDPALADAVLAALGIPPDFPIGDTSIRTTLIDDSSLGLAPDMLFELMSYLVGGERREKARALARGEDPDGDAATLDVLAVLQKLGPVRPDPEAFIECLEPLLPRLYSISSSPLATPGELHLTVDAVRYGIAGRQRLGVASTFLADRAAPGTGMRCYIQKAHAFALPKNASTPIIMVGPGTGVAPFRSFLWHRKAMWAKGKAWLFFGHQHAATDFLYRDELEAFLGDGTLTRLSTAWSRDGEAKVYVQDPMLEAGPELWAWLRNGAHFYICGDAKRMAKDVEQALIEISSRAGQISRAGARDFVAELKATGRYQADVY
ncbi:MAG TPA: sulfite reductase subunit alpha [Hyphomicrobiaceae bacterium]|nr:sulfite reductase subunit alpha [Hyphomicrobiaceae bacterium]